MFTEYARAIDVIEAQEKLHALSVAGFPHLKKAAREKLHKETHKRANPDRYEEPIRRVTLAEVAGMLSGRR